jgi:hypothetical protein
MTERRVLLQRRARETFDLDFGALAGSHTVTVGSTMARTVRSSSAAAKAAKRSRLSHATARCTVGLSACR